MVGTRVAGTAADTVAIMRPATAVRVECPATVRLAGHPAMVALVARPATVRPATAVVADTRPAVVVVIPAVAGTRPAAEVVIPAVAATPAVGITNHREPLRAASLLNGLL